MKICPKCGALFPDTFKFCAHDASPLSAQVTGDPLLGRTLEGRYRLQAFIGEGGYGLVYRAVDERLQRDVAVKILSKSRTGEPNEIQRFRHEADALARLKHPNIVSLLDFGHEPDIGFFMCIEYLHGETLNDRLSGGTMPILDFYYITRQIVDALAAAHTQGIIHRDIKTENIFLERTSTSQHGYTVRLLDFGIATITQIKRGEIRLTDPDMAIGTPLTVSPEALRGLPVDSRADIYSLGVVLYELLTGVEPFLSTSTEELIDEKLRGSLLPPSKRPGSRWIVPELDNLVLSMMALSPTLRPQTVEAVMVELDRIQARVEDAWAAQHLTTRRNPDGSNTPRKDPASLPKMTGLRVLVADDDRLQRRLIRGIVEGLGCSCDVVDSGEAAMAWLNKNGHPDGLIVDILMPGIDGISLLRQLRATGFSGPVIVCSGLTSGEIRREVEDLGLVRFLNKAKDVSSIPEILTALFAAARQLPTQG